MEQMFKKSLSIALLVSAFVANAGPVVSQIKIRPQSLDNARKVAGEVPGSWNTWLPDMEEWSAKFDVTGAYYRSFGSKLAPQLFGDALQSVKGETKGTCDTKCGTQTLVITGPDAPSNSKDLNAINFYLPTDYQGTLSFKPTISSFVLNFNFDFGFDEWWKGGFARIYAPFVHTKWNLNVTQTKTAGTDTDKELLGSALDYFAGKTPPAASYNEGDNKQDVIRHALGAHKMSGGVASEKDCESTCGGLTRNGFGEIRFELGWNAWRHGDYNLGFYLAGAAPTAPRVKADHLFSPQLGNNKHWELGAGVVGHWVFWRSVDEESHVGIYTDMTVTHLFKAREQRAFDLKSKDGENKQLSRYLLAAKMTSEVAHNLDATPNAGAVTGTNPATPAKFQWANELMPVANLTVQDVNVSVGAQLDLVAWFNYTMGGFTFDLGYNLWLQTCEKFGCVDKCGPRLASEKDTWVLLGHAEPVGQGAGSILYPLSFSDSKATLMFGDQENIFIDNSGIDLGTAQFAGNKIGTAARQTLTIPNDTEDPARQIRLTADPIFISVDDIDMNQRSQAMTHKVFGAATYRWDREGVVPFFGIGGGAEFAAIPCVKPCEEVKPKCDSCIKSGVSQWEVWAKVGFSFD